MAALATEGSRPQVTGDAPLDTGDARVMSDAPLDRKNHRDWLEVTFWGDYPRETKSRLVTEFLQAATGRGDLMPFEHYSIPDSQAGRVLTIPVKGCRCETGQWVATFNEGMEIRRMALSEAPAAQRVGLIVLEGVPCWGDSELARMELVVSALGKVIPDSLHWDAAWSSILIKELRLHLRCLAVFADTRDTGRAIRALLQPIDMERYRFSVGGVWAEGGRAIPIIFQPEGARDEKADEWAEQACQFVLDTRYRSWGAGRVLSITFPGVVDLGTSWAEIEQVLGVPIPLSGIRGEQVSDLGLAGALEMSAHITGNGRTRLWVIFIGYRPAEALSKVLLRERREGCAPWELRFVSTEAALAEGDRRWGRGFRSRHSPPNTKGDVVSQPPAYTWACAVNAPVLASSRRSGAGGRAERPTGRVLNTPPSEPARGAWASPGVAVAAEASGGGGVVVMAAIADLREGQTRLSGRVDALQTSVEAQRLSIQKVLADREADVAREAAVARATAGAFRDWVNSAHGEGGWSGARAGVTRQSSPAAGATGEGSDDNMEVNDGGAMNPRKRANSMDRSP